MLRQCWWLIIDQLSHYRRTLSINFRIMRLHTGVTFYPHATCCDAHSIKTPLFLKYQWEWHSLALSTSHTAIRSGEWRRCILFSTSTVSRLPLPRCIIFSNSQRCGQAVLTSLIFFSKRWTAYTNIPSLCVCHEPVCCCRRHRPTSTLHTSRIPHLPYPERIRRTADNRILTIMAPNRHPLWQDEPPLWQSQRRARYAIVSHAEHY